MIICDIGNTNVKFFSNGRVWKKSVAEFYSFTSTEKVCYINVNEDLKAYLKKQTHFIDLEPYVELDTIYQGLGIDRMAACKAVNDGIVIDAGSAISVDIMSNGVHLGGYILPGLLAYEEAYKSISSRLNVKLNPSVELDTFPQKTQDAISYATVKSILLILKETTNNKRVYFTGGDGQYLSKFFKSAVYDKTLVFRGLKDAISKLVWFLQTNKIWR